MREELNTSPEGSTNPPGLELLRSYPQKKCLDCESKAVLDNALSVGHIGSESNEFSIWPRFAKRVVDIVGSATALAILSPLFLLIVTLIKVTSRGPVFFRWKVVGLKGKHFVGYKFRTMFDGADRLREQLEHKNEMTAVFFKMRHDPRVTPVGKILRRFSLDELPQLWSVLKGDMSLVGPRPTQVFEYEQLEEWQKQRIGVKPGSVSLWIVSGKTRNFDEMVRSDLRYINKWSFWLDVKILIMAIPYVLLGKNY
jgi:lipopolysaccharide/colanic/teichoic acid biosynthesis glycosyltransferase